MSRSRRHQPFHGWSDRYSRNLDRRGDRRVARARLRRAREDVDVPPRPPTSDRDVGRSGRHRVDPRAWPELLRK
ncbi:MAG: hypothetical protein H6713_39690 [Myxococcales bacterium]|nr:hypothetical protein [Myxococcales bacterium]